MGLRNNTVCDCKRPSGRTVKLRERKIGDRLDRKIPLNKH